MLSRRKSKKANASDNRGLNDIMKFLTHKNVRYTQGLSPRMSDLENVYKITLVSQLNRYTMSSGALTSAPSLSPNGQINAWNSKWATAFKQYCVLRARAYVVPVLVGTAQGQVWTRVEETSTAPGGEMTNAERGVITLDSTEDDRASKVCIEWTPASSEDILWTDTASAINFSYLKIYANSTNTGTSASDSTTQVSTQIVYDIVFRYLA